MNVCWSSGERGVRQCGTCKRSLLARFQPDYERIIYVGDDFSAVCPARAADQVLAKPILYEKCLKSGRRSTFLSQPHRQPLLFDAKYPLLQANYAGKLCVKSK